jgi:hypothetical protein
MVGDVIIWWVQQHGRWKGRKVLNFQTLDGAHQMDDHSCGLLAINTIAHHFLPETPLLSMGNVREARIKTYLEIIDVLYNLVRILAESQSLDTHPLHRMLSLMSHPPTFRFLSLYHLHLQTCCWVITLLSKMQLIS